MRVSEPEVVHPNLPGRPGTPSLASVGTNPVDLRATPAYAGAALPAALPLPVLETAVAPAAPAVFFRARLAYAGVLVDGLSALLRHTESSPLPPPALFRATFAKAGGALPDAAAVAPALFKATFAYAG